MSEENKENHHICVLYTIVNTALTDTLKQLFIVIF